MQDPIALLAAEKIAQFLEQCGINYVDNEQLDDCVQDLTKLAHETRLNANIDSVIPCPDTHAPANRCRGSYRIQENNLKHGAVDYGGLDGAPRKKRRPRRSCLKGAGDSSVQKSGVVCGPNSFRDQAGAPPTEQSPDARAATVNEMGQVSNGIATEGSSANDPETNGKSGDSDAFVPEACGTTSEISSHTACDVDYSNPLTTPQLPAAESKIMETILVDCEKLNSAMWRTSADQKTPSLWDPNAVQIRGYVEGIAKRDFAEAIHHISAGNAALAKGTVQARYSESIFWDVITKHAGELDPLKLGNAKGPLTDFTVAEKEAARQFLRRTGDGNLTLGHLRDCRMRWRRLSNMRKRGVDKILCYHTSFFNSFCKSYETSDAEGRVGLIDKVLSWERLSEWYIMHLERIVAATSSGDHSGRLWLKYPFVSERLSIPEDLWDSSANSWASAAERVRFNSIPKYKALPDAHLPSAEHNTDADKSMFVILLPEKGQGALYVCSMIAVHKGDNLGIFAGSIRYSDDCNSARGIPGPEHKLWLDCRDITGALNLMGVAKPDQVPNVRLVWEYYCHLENGEWTCSWKVFVRATRVIKAFESIIRAASS